VVPLWLLGKAPSIWLYIIGRSLVIAITGEANAGVEEPPEGTFGCLKIDTILPQENLVFLC